MLLKPLCISFSKGKYNQFLTLCKCFVYTIMILRIGASDRNFFEEF